MNNTAGDRALGWGGPVRAGCVPHPDCLAAACDMCVVLAGRAAACRWIWLLQAFANELFSLTSSCVCVEPVAGGWAAVRKLAVTMHPRRQSCVTDDLSAATEEHSAGRPLT